MGYSPLVDFHPFPLTKHQNYDKNDTSYESQGCFHWKKKQKTIQNGRLKKAHFPAPPILNIFHD